MRKLLKLLFGNTIWLRLIFRFGRPKKIVPSTPKTVMANFATDNILQVRTVSFINALRFTRVSGFNDYTVLTHAFHESGKFAHIIGIANYWGIKKPKKWAGLVHNLTTHEYIDIKEGETEQKAVIRAKKLFHVKQLYVTPTRDNKWLVTLKQDFIDFISVPAALKWYISFIERMYPNAYDNRDNPVEYFHGLVNGQFQYATDPRYVEKLISTHQILLNLKDYEYIRLALASF